MKKFCHKEGIITNERKTKKKIIKIEKLFFAFFDIYNSMSFRKKKLFRAKNNNNNSPQIKDKIYFAVIF